ncbi:alkylphosphonate utilization protein [Bacteroidales bacterium OttesenSCG-928-C19]|nr:alkylphosphonate utilization protein [Bacteroidales bacterium OttesenSCG-928-C19]
MEDYPICPECRKENTYFDGSMFVCPDCAHEWTQEENDAAADNVPRDSNGTELTNGDSVIVIKTLDVKGSPLVIKQGTKVKNIRLTDDPALVDCKVEGTSVVLKTCFLRKS